jgi:branched-chain amino acid transport system permease protein
VSLFMQRGLFGLGQKLWQRVRAPRTAPAVQEERA